MEADRCAGLSACKAGSAPRERFSTSGGGGGGAWVKVGSHI